jgi:3'-5' exoribonuclease
MDSRLEEAIQARDRLVEIAKTFPTRALSEVCDVVLYHPKFVTQVGSENKHHAYEGGLAIHTFEVTTYAMKMAEMLPQAESEVVGTAAIFHDFMKVREYVPVEGGVGKTHYRNLVRHVAGSHAEFVKAIAGRGVKDEVAMRIEHAILAHHGRQDWGSPVEQQTAEAHILHYADMLSVRFGKGVV